MYLLGALVAAAVVLFALWIALVAFAGFGIRPLDTGDARPARGQEAALAALRQLEADDGPEVSPACRTQLLRPQGPARGTIIIWHGFTNCPAQFAEVAEIMCAEGYFVLLPRLPRHGNSDVLTRDLENLTAEEIMAFAQRCVDVAAGLPGPVSAIGLSVGGLLAAWAGAVRPEVDHVVAISPLVAPKGAPLPIVRLLVRFHSLVPSTWVWWDPRKKADLGESPHVYPGFPACGLVPFLRISMSLHDRHVAPTHRVKRAAFVSNPGDFAIRTDSAREMMQRVYASRTDEAVELALERSLGWWHDFVDQRGPHHGDPEQIVALLLAALGENDDVSAGGVVATTTQLGHGRRSVS